MAVFTFRAQVATAGTGEFRVFSNRFGEGYSQDVPNGRNNERQKWSVVVSGKSPVIQPVLDFIRAQAGVPFEWRAPNTSGLGWYNCKRYSQSDEGGNYWTLTMEFEQAYKP